MDAFGLALGLYQRALLEHVLVSFLLVSALDIGEVRVGGGRGFDVLGTIWLHLTRGAWSLEWTPRI